MLKKSILIVEDEELISSGIKLTLTQYGYECMTVNNGEDAIACLHSFSPDLVLMDIGLGGKLDGLSTAAIMRSQSQLQIIYISAQNTKPVFELAKATRPANYLTKPFSDGELIKAVELAFCQVVPTTHVLPNAPISERVSDGVFVFNEEEYKKVLFSDILIVQAEGMRTVLYCIENKTYIISLSSNHVIAQLDWPGLVRTSKSNYVNIHKVDSIKNDELNLQGYMITLSKTYREEFLSRIKKLKQNKP